MPSLVSYTSLNCLAYTILSLFLLLSHSAHGLPVKRSPEIISSLSDLVIEGMVGRPTQLVPSNLHSDLSKVVVYDLKDHFKGKQFAPRYIQAVECKTCYNTNGNTTIPDNEDIRGKTYEISEDISRPCRANQTSCESIIPAFQTVEVLERDAVAGQWNYVYVKVKIGCTCDD